MTSGTPQKTPKEPEQNKTYADKHGQSSHHQKHKAPFLKKVIRECAGHDFCMSRSAVRYV